MYDLGVRSGEVHGVKTLIVHVEHVQNMLPFLLEMQFVFSSLFFQFGHLFLGEVLSRVGRVVPVATLHHQFNVVDIVFNQSKQVWETQLPTILTTPAKERFTPKCT